MVELPFVCCLNLLKEESVCLQVSKCTLSLRRMFCFSNQCLQGTHEEHQSSPLLSLGRGFHFSVKLQTLLVSYLEYEHIFYQTYHS